MINKLICDDHCLINLSFKLINLPIVPNPVHHSTINEESDHPKHLAKDQLMRKNIRKTQFKTALSCA